MSVTNCKVIVVCANTDRVERANHSYPAHPQHLKGDKDLRRMWDVILAVDMTQDAGVPMDTVIVCNGLEAWRWWGKHDGKKTKNGTMRVFKRPNNGGSFAGYNYAYRNTDYFGYLFTEEDILIYGKDYYKQIIKCFRKRKPGFICLIKESMGRLYPHHCHGGVGFTTRDMLKMAEDENGDLPHPKLNGWNQRLVILSGEVPFTNIYRQLGYSLISVDGHKHEWSKDNFARPYYLLDAGDYAELGLRLANYMV